MEKETETIGSRIRECRKAMGLSQEALAELLYMKKNTICRYEKDEHDIPASVVVALAGVLHTTPNHLLLGESEDDPWIEDALQVLACIRDPVLRKLAVSQLRCIAEAA